MQEVKNKLNELLTKINIDNLDLEIFEEVDSNLNDGNINIEDKQEIVYLLIEVSKCLGGFKEIIKELPSNLQKILNSYNELKNIQILFETLENIKEYVIPNIYERAVMQYLNYLENDNNQLFIMYDNYYINRFNQYLLDYLNRIDINNEKFENGISKDIVQKVKELNCTNNLKLD